MSKVYSLASVTLTFVRGNNRLTIGGGAKQIGQISYTYSNDSFTMSATADGGYGVSHNASRNGGISVQVQQTSPHVAELTEFFNYAHDNPLNAECTCSCIDLTGNMVFQANGVFPQKLSENTVAATIGSRTFNFVAGEIIQQEQNNQGV